MADKLISSRTSGKDIVFKTNNSGTYAEVLRITAAGAMTSSAVTLFGSGSVTAPSLAFSADNDGTGTGLYRVAANSLGFAANGVNVGQYSSAGAWTLGPSSLPTTTKHSMSGPLKISRTSSSTIDGSISGPGTLYLAANDYFDSAGTERAVYTGNGVSILGISARTVSTDNAFVFFANTTSQTADAAITGTNTAIALATAGGLWSFGNANAANQGIKLLGNATGYTPSAFKFYQEDDSTLGSCTFQGNAGGSASAAIAIRVTRVGRVVTVDVPSLITVVPTGGSTNLNSNTNLPVWARPAEVKVALLYSYNNGAWSTSPVGFGYITTGGQIQVYRDVLGTAYTNSANAGWYHWQITYTV
jgi:hypothetical protein